VLVDDSSNIEAGDIGEDRGPGRSTDEAALEEERMIISSSTSMGDAQVH
jgi:hypothetical protein